MGVDTKGLVLTDCKDVMLLSELVGQALTGLIRSECQLVFGEFGFKRSAEAREAFAYPKFHLRPELAMLDIVFTFHGERRALKMFFACDCDNLDYGPSSVVMSMSCFGFSELFMKTALHALSLLGPVYYDRSDADDIPLALLDERVPPVLGAVSLDYIKNTSFSNWVRYYDAGRIGKGQSFQDFFGAPEQQIRDILAIDDATSCWKAIGQLADTVEATPMFLSDYHQEASAAAQLVGT